MEDNVICDICNTKNATETVKCTVYDVLLKTTDTPLSDNERDRLLLFALVAFLSPPLLPIVLILVAYAVYVMKVDKNFNSIVNVKKYINDYFLTFAMIVSITIAIGLLNLVSAHDGWSIFGYLSIIIAAVLGRYIIPFIYNFLFFDIMEKHRNFIVKNGIFSDGISNTKVNILGRERASVVFLLPMNYLSGMSY